MKIALVHLCSFGDCLYATLVARQIKRDHPACHLTWVIGDKYASILAGNPWVDAVHTVAVSNIAAMQDWKNACGWVDEQLRLGSLHEAYYTQILPDNISLYDGSIRSTIYRAYGHPIRGPHNPEVVLSASEEEKVASFVSEHRLKQFANVFLFECGPRSRQSSMTPERAEKIAHHLVLMHPSIAFVITADSCVADPTRQIIDGSPLSYRENAALARHCTGLIGCSSGITWLTTSTAGCQIPMLQILTASTNLFRFASVAWDFQHFGLDSSKVIEMADPDDLHIIDCIGTWITRSHSIAREQFHVALRPRRSHAAVAYNDIAGMKGKRAAARVLLGFVRLNGVSAIPWRLVASELYHVLRLLGKRLVRKFANA